MRNHIATFACPCPICGTTINVGDGIRPPVPPERRWSHVSCYPSGVSLRKKVEEIIQQRHAGWEEEAEEDIRVCFCGKCSMCAAYDDGPCGMCGLHITDCVCDVEQAETDMSDTKDVMHYTRRSCGCMDNQDHSVDCPVMGTGFPVHPALPERPRKALLEEDESMFDSGLKKNLAPKRVFVGGRWTTIWVTPKERK